MKRACVTATIVSLCFAPTTAIAFNWPDKGIVLAAPSDTAEAISPFWAEARVGDRPLPSNTVWWQCRAAMQSRGLSPTTAQFEACYDGVIAASDAISSADAFDSLMPGTPIVLPLTREQSEGFAAEEVVMVTEPQLQEVVEALTADLAAIRDDGATAVTGLASELRTLINTLQTELRSESEARQDEQADMLHQVDELSGIVGELTEELSTIANTQERQTEELGRQSALLENQQGFIDGLRIDLSETAERVENLTRQFDQLQVTDGTTVMANATSPPAPAESRLPQWFAISGAGILAFIALIGVVWLYQKHRRLQNTVTGQGERLSEVETLTEVLLVKRVSEKELGCPELKKKLQRVQPGDVISLAIEERRQGAAVPHINLQCETDKNGDWYLEPVGLKNPAGRRIKRKKVAGKPQFTPAQVFKVVLPAIENGEPIGIAHNAGEAAAA